MEDQLRKAITESRPLTARAVNDAKNEVLLSWSIVLTLEVDGRTRRDQTVPKYLLETVDRVQNEMLRRMRDA